MIIVSGQPLAEVNIIGIASQAFSSVWINLDGSQGDL
jgi:hypothetical protein